MSKYVPTTKFCRHCGQIHPTITLSDRVFGCPYCGFKQDRDVHAAENMVWIYNNLVGVGSSEFKHEDFEQ